MRDFVTKQIEILHNERSRSFVLLRLRWAALMVVVWFPSIIQAQSALDGFDPNANGFVQAIAVQGDGKILVGGSFGSIGGQSRNRIARLNPDGTADLSFNPNANGSVHAIVVLGTGKILVGGEFTSIGGQPLNRIARLNSDGTADLSFDPNANDSVYAITVQEDAKILVGGNFRNTNGIGGKQRNYIARLNSDGTVDTSFNPNANGTVSAIAVQADGKILLGGAFTLINQEVNVNAAIGGVTRNHIARLNTDGTADSSFNPNANGLVYAITVQVGGKILVGGDFSGANSISGQTRNYIARLNADGTLDASFDPNANSTVVAIAAQADGKILVGGVFTSLSPNGGAAVTRNRIARLNADGTAESSFDTSTNNSVFVIAMETGGKILVGGIFNGTNSIGGQMRNYIARLNADGIVETLFDAGATNTVYAIAAQANGKILVGGDFTSIGGQMRNRIARLNADGTADLSFNPNASGTVNAIAVQADGKILVGGFFNGSNSMAGQTRNYIARLNADGLLDTSFNPNANGGVYAIAVQADGKILVAGLFNGANSIGGQPRNRIARLNADGTADSFNPNASGAVISMAVQADGKILVGGSFNGANSIGGQTRNRIARLNTDGTTDLSFDPNANGFVQAIAVQPDGKILVGGAFNGANSIGGQSRNFIARLNADGAADTFFNPNANDSVWAISLQADGKILVGGFFNGTNSIGGQTRNRIARLNANGTADIAFDPNANNSVFAVALQADGKILVGGFFNGTNSIGGQTRNYIARLTNDTAALQDIYLGPGITLAWTFSGASPELWRATFELSTDGINYTFLGNGLRSVGYSAFALGGVQASTGQLYIRARGFYQGGIYNGSGSLREAVRVFNLRNFQEIYVTTHAPATATYLSHFTVAATAGSTLPVIYSSSGTCTNVGATFTMTSGTGTCTVRYDQPGDNNTKPAAQVIETVTAQKATATITLSNLTQPYDGNPKSVTTSTSPAGLTVAVAYTQNGNLISSPTNIGTYGVAAIVLNSSNYEGSATGVLTITEPAPILLLEMGTNNAAAVDSVTFVRGPFHLTDNFNFSSDHLTRIIIFTLPLSSPDSTLMVRASGIDLPIENVGVSGVPGLNASYIVFRLPQGLPTGDLQLTVTLRGITSNAATLTIVP